MIDDQGDFELVGGFYTRSIPESELQLAFDATDDGQYCLNNKADFGGNLGLQTQDSF